MTASAPTEFTMAIERVRSMEAVEQVYALKDNLETQKLVAAWPSARLVTVRTRRRRPRSESVVDTWSWLWSQREVDLDDLALKLGTSRPRAAAALEVARGNRLVYPDGTVHEHALLYVRALVARDLGAKPSKLARR